MVLNLQNYSAFSVKWKPRGLAVPTSCTVPIGCVNKCQLAGEVLALHCDLSGVCASRRVHVCVCISQQIKVIYLSTYHYCLPGG